MKKKTIVRNILSPYQPIEPIIPRYVGETKKWVLSCGLWPQDIGIGPFADRSSITVTYEALGAALSVEVNIHDPVDTVHTPLGAQEGSTEVHAGTIDNCPSCNADKFANKNRFSDRPW